MAAIKEVRQRIKAVKGIGQVTKAMKMVATVKMRRVQDKMLQSRAYTDTLYAMAARLVAAAGSEVTHPLLAEAPPGPEVLVVIGSDRGLCGSFNTGLFRYVLAQVRGQEDAVNIVAVGRKAREFWSRHKFNVVQSHERVGFPITWGESEKIGGDLATLHSFMRLSRIRLAYQRFVSPGVSRPIIVPWLPFQQPEAEKTAATELRCEPSVAQVLDLILPRALTAQLHRALLEAQASEQGARMVAMDNATTNAEELTGDLTLLANKLRQTGITKELLEITTGAEALNA